VLRSVTRDDNEDSFTRGGEHRYTVSYEYGDGYYDRGRKEFYGFSAVRSIYSDGSEVQRKFGNREYYQKGMEIERVVMNGDAEGKQVIERVITEIDEEPYQRVKARRSITYDGVDENKSVERKETYEYDGWGNVTRYDDGGDEREFGDEVIVTIEYWHEVNKYLHGHPGKIEVRDTAGKLLRRREGSYGGNGRLERVREYYGESNYVESEYRYDGYGNIVEKKDWAGVRTGYGYEGKGHQYVEWIWEKGDGRGSGEYESQIGWDVKYGRKAWEADVNGNVMRYEYDGEGRLKEVWSPYDDGVVPAVSYWYERAGRWWYAVTRNKVRYAGDDGSVLLTVVEVDGLGRVRRTGKSGEVYRGGVRERGWNVSGAVEYDGKGREVKLGQVYFVKAVEGEGGIGELLRSGIELRNVTEKGYDGLDRVVRQRLADGSEERWKYGVMEAGGKRYIMDEHRDALGRVSERRYDARGNIAEVEERGTDGGVLTRAKYRYNVLGEMERAEDAGGNGIAVGYDMVGRRVRLWSADSGEREYRYNEKGQLAWETSSALKAEGKRIGYEYDGYGRREWIRYPDSEDVRYEWGGADEGGKNLAGRLKAVRDGSGEIEYWYGKLGETVRERRELWQSYIS
jgi:YD repeat-containing protein